MLVPKVAQDAQDIEEDRHKGSVEPQRAQDGFGACDLRAIRRVVGVLHRLRLIRCHSGDDQHHADRQEEVERRALDEEDIDDDRQEQAQARHEEELTPRREIALRRVAVEAQRGEDGGGDEEGARDIGLRADIDHRRDQEREQSRVAPKDDVRCREGFLQNQPRRHPSQAKHAGEHDPFQGRAENRAHQDFVGSHIVTDNACKADGERHQVVDAQHVGA